MSNKIAKWLKIVSIAIWIGIYAVQMIFAICWAFRNGNHIQSFYETSIYFGNAIDMVSDGWHLSGYAVIIRIFMLLEIFLDENYIIVLYLFQVFCSLICYAYGYRCLTRIMFKKHLSIFKSLLPAGYILTLPTVWQMQFSVLPDALCLCVAILIFVSLANLLMVSNKLEWNHLLIVGGGLLLLGVFHHHYFYGAWCLVCIAAFISLIRMLNKKYRGKKGVYTIGILILSIIICPVVANAVNQTVPKKGEYITHSLSAELLERFVFEEMSENSPYYNNLIADDAKDYLNENPIIYMEEYYRSFGPMIENNNPKAAEETYKEMARVGFSVQREEIISEIIKETVAYSLVPIAMEKYMYNNGNSLYGHNYSKMYETSARLTADYMHVGMNGLLAVGILGWIVFGMYFIRQKEGRGKRIFALLWYALGIWSITFPQMLFSVGKFDYRIGLFSTFIWGIFAITNILNKTDVISDDAKE